MKITQITTNKPEPTFLGHSPVGGHFLKQNVGPMIPCKKLNKSFVEDSPIFPLGCYENPPVEALWTHVWNA